MPEFEESEGFKLKSGNKTSFKEMGSSPVKHTDHYPWSKDAGHTLKDHAKNAISDPIGTATGIIKGKKTSSKKEQRSYQEAYKAAKDAGKSEFMWNSKRYTVKDSPAKHTTNRAGHEDSYGAGHDNSAHPKYWKVKERTVTHSDENEDYNAKYEFSHTWDDDGTTRYTNDDTKPGATANSDYDLSNPNSDTRKNRVKTKVYLSDKDGEIQRTKNKAAGKGYTGINVYNELPGDVGYTSTNKADRVGKTDRNTYNTKSYKSKSKSKSSKSSNTYKTNVFGKVKKGKGRVKKALKNIKSKITFWNPND